MAVRISINVDGDRTGVDAAPSLPSSATPDLPQRLHALEGKHHELVQQMGDEISPFPKAKVGGYISHFRIVLELNAPGMPASVVTVNSPPAAQSVAWSDSFVYEGPEANHRVKTPLPATSALSDTISEADFINKPAQFFKRGCETLWLQILNLDARMDSEIGNIRIILGETLKREYPDLFKPSLGVAQSLGSSGFPATLFFNPYAIIETPLGAFRAVHGILSYGRVTAFPPVGTPVSISTCIPVEEVGSIRANLAAPEKEAVKSFGRIVALSHPIDMEMQLPGDEPYHFVENLISRASAAAAAKK